MSAEPQTSQELDLGERVRTRGKILETLLRVKLHLQPEIKVSNVYTYDAL